MRESDRLDEVQRLFEEGAGSGDQKEELTAYENHGWPRPCRQACFAPARPIAVAIGFVLPLGKQYPYHKILPLSLSSPVPLLFCTPFDKAASTKDNHGVS